MQLSALGHLVLGISWASSGHALTSQHQLLYTTLAQAQPCLCGSQHLMAVLMQVFGRTAFEACSAWFRSLVITSEHVEDSKASSVLKFRYSLTLSCMQAFAHADAAVAAASTA